jgi:hypothetical protein
MPNNDKRGGVMQELIFKVTFLSDVVLPATSNTEGKIEPLDFIAGSTFLGMVAKKEYGNFKDDFTIFHSGKVRFGDATPLQDKTPTYKIPLSFFYEKLTPTKVINQVQEDLRSLTQAKQLRAGYISKDFVLSYLDYNYAQKSGYNKSKRRSRDSSMYGYSSIQKGTKWQFVLKYDANIVEESEIEQIKKALVGRQRLGKSKSSQYGEIEIASLESDALAPNKTRLNPLGSEVILYLKSRVALSNKEGNPSYDLRYLAEGLKDEQIDWSRTQLRTSTYNRYDGSRKSKDTQRVVINAGSVVVLRNISQEMVSQISEGVGLYLSEGFGEILINPTFLMEKSFTLSEYKVNKTVSPVDIYDDMVKFLFIKEEERRKQLDIASTVHTFIEANRAIYSKAMNAQWGTIRSFCSSSNDELIKNRVEAYITDGVAKDKWQGERGKNLLNAIEQSRSPLAFTKLLSMEMPKIKENSND